MPESDANTGGRFNLPRSFKGKFWLIIVGLGLAFLGLKPFIVPHQSRSLTLSYHSRPGTPALLRIEANGHVIDAISTGRNSGGGTYYKNRYSDEMDFRVFWYDAYENKAWTADIPIRSRELAAYDPHRDHIVLDIWVGPGADVEASTSQSEFLQMIHQRRENEITDDMRAPVILRALCAMPVALDDPRVAPMVGVSHNPNDVAFGMIADRLEARENYISKNGEPIRRCKTGE